MHWRNRIAGRFGDKLVTVRRPDYEEQRQGDHLLIWRDLPYWMIVDHELRSFLAALDETQTIRTLLASQSPSQKKGAAKALGLLYGAGIVSDGQSAPSSRAAVPESGIANICVNVTARCNLRCRFCYNLDALSTDKGTELGVEEITHFLDSIRPLLTKDCSLTLLGASPCCAWRRRSHWHDTAAGMGCRRSSRRTGTV